MPELPNQDGGEAGAGAGTPPATPPASSNPGNTPPAASAAPADNGTDGEWWSEAQKRGFKTQADVWKSYGEAEKELSKKGEDLKSYQKFEEEVAPVLKVIYETPELLESVRKAMGAPSSQQPTNLPNQPDNKPNNGATAPQNTGNTDVRDHLVTEELTKFEDEISLSKLDPETQKEVRQIIGRYLVDPNGQPVDLSQVNIRNVRTLFRNAYAIAKQYDKKLSELVKEPETDTNVRGYFPSMPSQPIDASGDIQLTPEQKKVAAHMPGGEEAYKKQLKSMLQTNK